MAVIISKIMKFTQSPLGKCLLAIIYALMLLLILIFFDGKGEFIYEAF